MRCSSACFLCYLDGLQGWLEWANPQPVSPLIMCVSSSSSHCVSVNHWFIFLLCSLCASARELLTSSLSLAEPKYNPNSSISSSFPQLRLRFLLHWSLYAKKTIFFNSHLCDTNLAWREGKSLLNLLFNNHQFQWQRRLTWWRGWFLCPEFSLIMKDWPYFLSIVFAHFTCREKEQQSLWVRGIATQIGVCSFQLLEGVGIDLLKF